MFGNFPGLLKRTTAAARINLIKTFVNQGRNHTLFQYINTLSPLLSPRIPVTMSWVGFCVYDYDGIKDISLNALD